VVASRLPAVEALVEHGISGWLVQPDDPAALAAGLHRVLGDVKLAEKLSRNGLTVVDAFTWNRAVEKLLAVYRELSATP
jgi:glycosyltransferase involved in cell wall biosynthesis